MNFSIKDITIFVQNLNAYTIEERAEICKQFNEKPIKNKAPKFSEE